MTKQLSLYLIWPQNFSPEGILLVHVRNCKFQSSLKVLILEQGLLSWSAPSPWWCKSGFTMDSDAGVPADVNSWHAWILGLSGFFLNILTNFLSSEGERFVLLSVLGRRSGDTSKKTIQLRLFSRDLPNVCKFRILTSLLSSLDFPIILSIGQYSESIKVYVVQSLPPGNGTSQINHWKP